MDRFQRLDGAKGAVDLTRVGCLGCAHRSVPSGMTEPICRAHPPIFRAMTPVLDAAGNTKGVAPAAWEFPPALLKCGEFKAG